MYDPTEKQDETAKGIQSLTGIINFLGDQGQCSAQMESCLTMQLSRYQQDHIASQLDGQGCLKTKPEFKQSHRPTAFASNPTLNLSDSHLVTLHIIERDGTAFAKPKGQLGVRALSRSDL